MRHGQSQANVEHKIISSVSSAEDAYDLTDQGRQQVGEAGQRTVLTSATVIYASDYARARETAEIMQRALKASAIHLSARLRERNFGDWEGTSTDNYQLVWEQDATEMHANCVETPGEVLERTLGLILALEKQYSDRDILLVSHGDTLQILQCGFHGVSPYAHRSLPHLEVAEIRPVSLLEH